MEKSNFLNDEIENITSEWKFIGNEYETKTNNILANKPHTKTANPANDLYIKNFNFKL